eukprot:Gb_38713 [translate_table: standard]
MEFDLIRWDEQRWFAEELLFFHRRAARDGYRLATVKEASHNLEEVSILFKGSRWLPHEYTRLLDGWMSRDTMPKQGYKELPWNWMLVVKTGKFYPDDHYGQIHEAAEKEAALFFFTMDRLKDQVEWFLESTRDPSQLLAPDGRTLLHLAVAAGQKEILELILNKVEDNSKKIVRRPDALGMAALLEDNSKKIVRRSDALGMTALLEAVKRGDEGIVKILLEKGAQPVEERDIDGKTALHYAAQLPDDEHKAIRLAELVLAQCFSEKCQSYRYDNKLGDEECICKSLLLWAKASGIGTAEESAISRKLRSYLSDQAEQLRKKGENLLQTAARLNNKRMIGELLNRGFMNAKTSHFLPEEKKRVEEVSKELDAISRSAADTPAEDDSLGRRDFAIGLAALFLNPFVASPIVVGVSGEWGSGKSSVLIQTEYILLRMAAALAFPDSGVTPRTEAIPGMEPMELSVKGKMVCDSMKSEARRLLKPVSKKYEDPVKCILSEKASKFESYFKSLATMDRSQMFRTSTEESKHKRLIHLLGVLSRAGQYIGCNSANSQTVATTAEHDGDQQESSQSHTKDNEHKESESQEDQAMRAPPGILTIRYNAWRYREESEAWAGIAVEVTKGIEARMTKAQQLATRWRYSWRKNSSSIWLQLILPFLFVAILSPFVAWGAWVLISESKSRTLEGLKYGCIPLTVIVIVWTVIRTLMGIVKPVSEEIAGYILQSPDHTQKLGYQENVIEDIKFMKKEIGKEPSRLWMLVASCWGKLSFHTRVVPHVPNLQIRSASASKLRLIVFVDDLDRCEESVILKVLSAVNLVLAECKINVVLGMDKTMIERAINSKFGGADKSYQDAEVKKLAEKYLRKIIQIPLDIPEPSDGDLKKFLGRHVGPSSESSQNDRSHVPNSSQPNSSGNYQSPRQSTQDDPATSRDGNASQNDRTHVPNSSQPKSSGNYQSPRQSTQDDPSTLGDGNARGDSIVNIHQTVTPNIESKPRSSAEDEIGSILRGQMLMPQYTASERDAFHKLRKLVTQTEKNPREWKRFLNYHRLAWNILSQRNDVTRLTGWQLQLVMWIFVCWRWRDQMDILIKKWPRYVDDRTRSLGDVVQKCISYRQIKESSRRRENVENHDLTDEEAAQKQRKIEKEKQRRHDDGELNNMQEVLSAPYNDVSKDAINAFQVFRFYCIPRHISIPP